MNRSLLIVGAGTYGMLAYEIAVDMDCFGRICFVDDNAKRTENGIDVIGTTADIKTLAAEYSDIVVAIGRPDVRLSVIERIKSETALNIATLISPRAYVSPSAVIHGGCVIEPMAVVHTGCVIQQGCLICAGAVINHKSTCEEGVHVDCNATVTGYATVPKGTKIKCNELYGA